MILVLLQINMTEEQRCVYNGHGDAEGTFVAVILLFLYLFKNLA